MKIRLAIAAVLCGATACAAAAPVKYTIDSKHTYPSFETDHFGFSTFRGKFNSSSGTVVLDREGGTGTLDVTIDAASIDLGHDELNEHIKKDAAMLDVKKHPTVTYTGKLAKFVDGAPTEVDGALTLHGVTKPVKLKIERFTCGPHPVTKKEICGAHATGTFNRDEFGIDYAKQHGFNMETKVDIQVEARKAE